ncbi:hypothetical protein J6590_015766 [Homalodisca vitripennis]|nr:hypothetical protein J6590_015766 [Homalodisca vitripennis]
MLRIHGEELPYALAAAHKLPPRVSRSLNCTITSGSFVTNDNMAELRIHGCTTGIGRHDRCGYHDHNHSIVDGSSVNRPFSPARTTDPRVYAGIAGHDRCPDKNA